MTFTEYAAIHLLLALLVCVVLLGLEVVHMRKVNDPGYLPGRDDTQFIFAISVFWPIGIPFIIFVMLFIRYYPDIVEWRRRKWTP